MKLIIPLSIVIVCLSILAIAHNSDDYAVQPPVQSTAVHNLNPADECWGIPKEYVKECEKDVHWKNGGELK